jgi:ACS family glucarate transporter-like MFS transporter
MFGGVVGVFLGGFIADMLTRDAADPVRARRLLALGCYLTAATSLYFGVQAEQPIALAAFFFVAFCTMHVTLPNWWSCAIPQGGRHIGVVFGLMNGMGVAGALVSQLFVGYFADWQKDRGLTGREQWDPIFWVYIAVLLCAAAAWWAYRLTPLDDERTTDRA